MTVGKNPRELVISSRLGYFANAGRKRICESNFIVDEMENQQVQKKVKNMRAKRENLISMSPNNVPEACVGRSPSK